MKSLVGARLTNDSRRQQEKRSVPVLFAGSELWKAVDERLYSAGDPVGSAITERR
jgi:hypothetical protein